MPLFLCGSTRLWRLVMAVLAAQAQSVNAMVERIHWKWLGIVVTACALLLPHPALAQSAIAGQVADTSGGVLPGVTVEAASPALIEGTRTAISDGQGRYSIENLRPGTYKVTFTLPGFST